LANQKLSFCESCVKAKALLKKLKPNDEALPVLPMEMASSDLKVMHCPSRSGYQYVASVIDKGSKYVYMLLLRKKDDFHKLYDELLTQIKHQKGDLWKKFKTDGGGEYVNKYVQAIHAKHGIIHIINAPYKSQLNFEAERFNRTLIEAVNATLAHTGLPEKFWEDVATNFVHVKNRTYHKTIDSTPIELWEGIKQDVGLEPPIGCLAMPTVPEARRSKKTSFRAHKTINLGKSIQKNAYNLLDLETNQVIQRAKVDIFFRPDEFPLAQVARGIERLSKYDKNQNASAWLDPAFFFPDQSSICRKPESWEPPDLASVSPDLAPVSPDFAPASPDTAFEKNLHDTPITPYEEDEKDNYEAPSTAEFDRICNRLISNMYFTKETSVNMLKPVKIPDSIDEAMTLSDWPFWKEAIEKELNALLKAETWIKVTEMPQHLKALTSRWVFKFKPATKIEPARYKARLVAHGYKQRKGVDFNETYAAVARMASFRTLVSIAAAHNLEMTQIDIGNAFLHGTLQEDVYLSAPPGFPELGLLKLQKALYGLKQAPRLFYEHLTKEFKELGFFPMISDPCILKHKSSNFYVLLYVDDIILATGKNSPHRKEVEDKLSEEFELKNFGKLRSFIGIEVNYLNDKILLTQGAYIRSLLDRFGMSSCKTCDTPAASNSSTNFNDDRPCDGPYRELIGALLYLSATRPDISAAVSELSSHLEHPTNTHWQAAKRVLRYLAGTVDSGVAYNYTNTKQLTLLAFSDSDWATCHKTRKSRTGYVVYTNAGPISWKSKLQPTVAVSTCEAEYLALVETIKELMWLKQLLTEMGVVITQPIKIFVDNQAAIALASHPSQHCRTKHIDIRHHFIREHISNHTVELYYVDTKENVADLLTKATTPAVFKHLVGKLVC
jgi:hypothetical protein